MKKTLRWWDPRIGALEKKFIARALESHFPNEGKMTGLFEKRIAALTGSRYAVAVTNGTAAIFLSLKALGVGPGDEVIVPDITFIATANAVEMCGAKPVLTDVDPATICMGPANFRKAVTKKTKAVIPVHVSGRACDMAGIARVAKAHSVDIVEDAAEAFMSKHKGIFLGTFGRTGCFSFSPNKTITTGQGGIIVTDDRKLYTRLRELKDQGRPSRGTGGDDLHNSIGYNFKFTDLQAAVGLGQLSYLKRRLARMKSIYRAYVNGLEGVKGISLFKSNLEKGEIPQWTDALAERRDGLDAYLRAKGIDCRRYWFPVHRQKPYRIADRHFPESTRLSPRALWLPSAFTMSDSDVKRVCKHIRKFFLSGKKG